MGLFDGAGNNADLNLKVKADTSDAKEKIEQLGLSFTKLTGAFAAGNIAADVIRKSMATLQNVVSGSINAWAESERVTAQMNATLTSTKHAAGLSAQQLEALSVQMQRLTSYSDDAVMSAQNLLLTFTNITGGTFEEATRVVLDMSTALGTDLKSSAIQLGKALQDPINGVSALARVGVNFSESQKEVITQMVKTGDTIGAQKLVLAELNKEFGGSATAAAKTFGGQMEQLRNQVDDLQEEIGHGLTAAISNVVYAFKDATAGMQSTVDTGKLVFKVFSGITEFAANASAGVHTLASSVVSLGSYVAQAAGFINGIAEGEMQFWRDFRASTSENNRVMTDFALNLHDRNEQTLADWNNMTEGAESYATAGPEAYQETAKAAQEASAKVKAANDAIKNTTQQIQELQAAQNQSKGNARRSIAEAYLEEARKIQDLRKQSSEATTYEDKVRLTEEIAREELAFSKKKELGVDYKTEIAEANRRAQMTEFERTIEDILAKQKAEEEDFKKKLTRLNEQLLAEENKRSQIAAGEGRLTATMTVEQARRNAVVAQGVQEQLNQYTKLGTAVSNAYGAKSPYQVAAFNNPVRQSDGLSDDVIRSGLSSSLLTPLKASVLDRSVPANRSTPSGNTLNFHFNGSVAGDDGIKQAITGAVLQLNREATLRTYAGQ